VHAGNDVYANAESMSQRYMQQVLHALHNGRKGGKGIGGGSRLKGGSAAGQSVDERIAAPPDNRHKLQPEMARLYATYVGQFV